MPRSLSWIKTLRTTGLPWRGAGDTLFLMLPQIMAMGASVLSAIIIARMLGAASMGRYALAMSFAAAIASITECGIGSTMVRYGALAHSSGDTLWLRRIVQWASLWRVIVVSTLALVCALFSGVISRHVWHDPEMTPLIFTASLVAVPIALAGMPIYYYQAIRAFARRVLVETIWKSATLLSLGILALLSLWSVQALIITNLFVSSGLMGLISLLAARDVPRADRASAATLAFPAPTLAVHQATETEPPRQFFQNQIVLSVLNTTTEQVDLWMVAALLDPVTTGIYAVARRLTTPFQVLVTALGTAIFPRLAGQNDLATTRVLMRRTLSWAGLAGILSIALAIGIPMLAPLLFGHEFITAVLLGQVLCLRYCVSILVTPLYYAAMTLGLTRHLWQLQLAQLALLIVMTILTAPFWGVLAPAMALIFRELLGALVLWFWLQKRLQA